ncbi:MAG: hypothetical protein K2G26_06160 [Clostridia bacterium]|nr:hypothetical protein [Clostridia bacterium]
MDEEERNEVVAIVATAAAIKRNKIIAATVVNAVLLVFIIAAVLIAQIVQISVLKRRKTALLGELYRLEQQLEEDQSTLDRLQTDEKYREIVIQLVQMGVDVTPKFDITQ